MTDCSKSLPIYICLEIRNFVVGNKICFLFI